MLGNTMVTNKPTETLVETYGKKFKEIRLASRNTEQEEWNKTFKIKCPLHFKVYTLEK